MSNGRSERRIARTVSVEVCVEAEAKLNGRMLTENVSAHGARVFMERKVEPGQQVLVSSPKEGVRSLDLLWVWNCPAGWSFGQSLTNDKRPRLLTTC